jgi:hypothetical protein
METFEIDLDSECVWLDDAWLNRDDLAKKIKTMIDAGDFQIARPSSALESLTKALASARLLALRISPELSEALNAAASSTGRPVGALAREALQGWLAQHGMQATAVSAAPLPLTTTAAPMPLTEAVAQAAQPEATVTTEPASPSEAEEAVALTPKSKDNGKGEDVEKRWFDK